MSAGHPNAIVPFEESLDWAFSSGNDTSRQQDLHLEDFFPVVYDVDDHVEVRFMGDVKWLPAVVVQRDFHVPTELVIVRVDVPLETNPMMTTKVNGTRIESNGSTEAVIIKDEVEVPVCFVRPCAPRSPSDHRVVQGSGIASTEGFFDAGAYVRGDYVEVRLISPASDGIPTTPRFEWKRGRISAQRANGAYDVRIESGTDLHGVQGCHMRHHFRPRDAIDYRVTTLFAEAHVVTGAAEESGETPAATVKAAAPEVDPAATVVGEAVEHLEDTAAAEHPHHHRTHRHHKHHHHHHKHGKHHHHHKHGHHRHHHHHKGPPDSDDVDPPHDVPRGVPLTELPPAQPCEWRSATVVKYEKTGLYVLALEDGSQLRGVDPRRLMPASRAEVRAAAEERRARAQTWCPHFPAYAAPAYSSVASTPAELPHNPAEAVSGGMVGAHVEQESVPVTPSPHDISSAPGRSNRPDPGDVNSNSWPEQQVAPHSPGADEVINVQPTEPMSMSVGEGAVATAAVSAPVPRRASKPSVSFSDTLHSRPLHPEPVPEHPQPPAAASAEAQSAASLAPAWVESRYDVNDKVEVLQPRLLDGEPLWLLGRIEAVHPDGASYFVRYSDASRDEAVAEKRMRRLSVVELERSSYLPAVEDAVGSLSCEAPERATKPLRDPPPVDHAVSPAGAQRELDSSAQRSVLQAEFGLSSLTSPVSASQIYSAPALAQHVTVTPQPWLLSPSVSPVRGGAATPAHSIVGAWLSVFNAASGSYEPCRVEGAHPDGTFDARNLQGELHSHIDHRYVQGGVSATVQPAGFVLLPPLLSPSGVDPQHSPFSHMLGALRGSREYAVGSSVEAQVVPAGDWLAAVVVGRLAADIYVVYLQGAGQEAAVVSASLRPLGTDVSDAFEGAGTGAAIRGVLSGPAAADLGESSLDGSLDDDSLVVLGAAPPPLLFNANDSMSPPVEGSNGEGSGYYHTPIKASRPHSVPHAESSPGRCHHSARSQSAGQRCTAEMADVPVVTLLSAEKPVSFKARLVPDTVSDHQLGTAAATATDMLEERRPQMTVVTRIHYVPGQPSHLIIAVAGPHSLFPAGARLLVSLRSEHVTFDSPDVTLRWPVAAGTQSRCSVAALVGVTLSSQAPGYSSARATLCFESLLLCEVAFDIMALEGTSRGQRGSPLASHPHLQPTPPSSMRPSTGPYSRKTAPHPKQEGPGSGWVRRCSPLASSLLIVVCPGSRTTHREVPDFCPFVANSLRASAEQLGAHTTVTVVDADSVEQGDCPDALGADELLQVVVVPSGPAKAELRRQSWMAILRDRPALQQLTTVCAGRVRITSLSTSPSGAVKEGAAGAGWVTSFGMDALDLHQLCPSAGDALCQRMWACQQDCAARLRYLSALQTLGAAQGGSGQLPAGLLLVPQQIVVAQSAALPAMQDLVASLCALSGGRFAHSDRPQHNDDVDAHIEWRLLMVGDHVYRTASDDHEILTGAVPLNSTGLVPAEWALLMPFIKATMAAVSACALARLHGLPQSDVPPPVQRLAEHIQCGAARSLLTAYGGWEMRQQLGPLPAAVPPSLLVEEPLVEAARVLEEGLLALAPCISRSGWARSVADVITAHQLPDHPVVLVHAGDGPPLWVPRRTVGSPAWAPVRRLLVQCDQTGWRPPGRELHQQQLEWSCVPTEEQAHNGYVPAFVTSQEVDAPPAHPRIEVYGDLRDEFTTIIMKEAGVRDAFSAEEAAACLVSMGCASVRDFHDMPALFTAGAGELNVDALRGFLREGGVPLFVAAKLAAYLQRSVDGATHY
jgi:hypothetical protein